MGRRAFVTGSTGFLGSWLTAALLKSDRFDKVIVISRKSAVSNPQQRVHRQLLATRQPLNNRQRSKLVVLNGDIRKNNIGLDQKATRFLSKSNISDIYHSAAIADFNLNDKKIVPTNVNGTLNLFKVSKKLSENSNHERSICVHHISTVAVAGKYQGDFKENNYNEGQQFNNSYERSKFEAEGIARQYRLKGMAVKIYRPAIITGDSKSGITTNFKMVYQPIHFFSLNLFNKIPANRLSQYSFVPVDKVASAILELSDESIPSLDAYHIVNPSQINLVQFIAMCKRALHFKAPELVSSSKFKSEWLSVAQWKLIEPFVPYFNYYARFNASMTNSILKKRGFVWPAVDNAYISKMIHFCIQAGFLKKRR